MLLGLLTTTMKTGAENSSTTLAFSYKRVCHNSENNLNTHCGKKKNSK
jgi:hypothetical protein